MTNWKTKITSRKMWLAIAEFVSMLLLAFGVADDTVTQVSAIIMAGAGVVAYIIAEGLIDAKATSSTPVFFEPDEMIEEPEVEENE